MRKLIIGLIIVLLCACSTQGSGGSSKPSEFESSMQEAYDVLSAGFDEDTRELTRKQKDRLSYLLYSKKYDIEPVYSGGDAVGFCSYSAVRVTTLSSCRPAAFPSVLFP